MLRPALALALAALLAVALAMAGCTPDPSAPAEPPPVTPAPANEPAADPAPALRQEGGPAAPAGYRGGPVENGGTIAGRVVFVGTPPKVRKLRVDKDHEACGKGPLESEELVLGEGGTIRWAVVYLEKIDHGKPLDTLPKASIDNRACVFVPHVLVAAVNAPIEMKNSDPIAHTMDAYPRMNSGLGVQLGQGHTATKSFEFAETIRIECQIHKWMSCFLWVVEHPYYAVTGADGAFELTDVPPGAYTLRAWVERFDDEQAQAVTVEAGKRVEATIEFRAP